MSMSQNSIEDLNFGDLYKFLTALSVYCYTDGPEGGFVGNENNSIIELIYKFDSNCQEWKKYNKKNWKISLENIEWACDIILDSETDLPEFDPNDKGKFPANELLNEAVNIKKKIDTNETTFSGYLKYNDLARIFLYNVQSIKFFIHKIRQNDFALTSFFALFIETLSMAIKNVQIEIPDNKKYLENFEESEVEDFNSIYDSSGFELFVTSLERLRAIMHKSANKERKNILAT